MHLINCTLLLISISVAAFGCNRIDYQKERHFVLQPGDLLFQDLDCGPQCDAIEKVTTGYQGMNLSHVGIVAKDDDSDFVVIEAVSAGVEVTPLQIFLERSFDARHHPKVIIGRLKEPYRRLIPYALKEARALKGKPYDRVFSIDNEAYYCSELIYEIFLKANDNRPVFKLQPMTFKDPDTREFHPAWESYFTELGAPIPEGQPGINPGGISRSPVLTIVYTYGTPSRCLLNFVRAKLELEKNEIGTVLEVLLDKGEPVRNVPESFAEQDQEVMELKNIGDHFCLKVRRRK